MKTRTAKTSFRVEHQGAVQCSMADLNKRYIQVDFPKATISRSIDLTKVSFFQRTDFPKIASARKVHLPLRYLHQFFWTKSQQLIPNDPGPREGDREALESLGRI